MANIDIAPTRTMPNLIHTLSPYADRKQRIVNAIVEINTHSLNKYELITETGHLKLDRVGYSPMVYPFVYAAIPGTIDMDGDPLDIVIAHVSEPLIPGSLADARILGIMKFVDDGEQDDKIIAVLNDDKRCDHIKTYEDLGEHFLREAKYYFEHYKDLKKPGTGVVEGYFDIDEAARIVDECRERYQSEYAPKVVD